MAGPVSHRGRDHAEAREAIRRGRFADARRLLDESLAANPDDVNALCLGALTRWRAHEDLETAQTQLERARSLRPDNAEVLTLSAEFALHLGDVDAVYAHAARALEIDGGASSALVAMARADARRIEDGALQRMRRLAEGGALTERRRRFLLNAIGRVLDAREEYDEAFAFFDRSNRLAGGSYDRGVEVQRLAAARRLFTRDFFAKRAGFGLPGAGCVFIHGPPRTGSTLIEQMLAAHPNAASCGESEAMRAIDRALRQRLTPSSKDIASYAHVAAITPAVAASAARAYLTATDRQRPRRADGAPLLRRLDKKLSNFYHTGLIRLMFPDAVRLWVRRHPLDVCLSCFTQGFEGHDYARDLATLAHFHQIQHAHMRLWKQRFPGEERHLSYEAFVGAPESETRRLLADLGLAWNEACLSPQKAAGFVATSSAAQVRAPVHGRAVERWRNYEAHLQPLIRGLGGMARIEEMLAE